ncbi:unnamed protein product [Symbiodinium sp. KB8]|nr:unnamed protein product [Symbiodinium sp. KB8]
MPFPGLIPGMPFPPMWGWPGMQPPNGRDHSRERDRRRHKRSRSRSGSEVGGSNDSVLIRRSLMGRVIGKGGATINNIRNESGARIDAEDRDEDHCEFTIRGTEEQVQRAKAMLLERADRAGHGGAAAVAVGDRIEDGEASETMEFPIAVMGGLIGSRGAKINEVRQTSGAKVQVDKFDALDRSRSEGKTWNSTWRSHRDFCKALAEETMEVLARGWYMTDTADDPVDISVALDRAMEGSEELCENVPLRRSAASKHTSGRLHVQVTEETSLQALYRIAEEAKDLSATMLLNFASAKNPGGGFLGGAVAQEESLARSSGLFPCLEQFKDSLYARNRTDPNGCLYSDDMIFSPCVPFFRTDAGAFLDKPVCCSVLTAAAPNAGAAKGPAVKEVVSVLKARVVRVLRIAKANDLRTLILGAWGCGVFKNDPQEVAKAFHVALDLPELRGAFDYVLFPIPDPKMKVQFERVLRPSGAPPTAAALKAAAQAVAKVDSEQEELANSEPSRTREHCDEGPVLTASGEDLQEEEIANPTKVCVELVSFGYSSGAGQPLADQHFDARGLENPDRRPRRHLTGLDARLRSEVMQCQGAEELLEKIRSSALQHAARSEGAPVRIAVGCAWGKHRSVTMCEEAARSLRGTRTPAGKKLYVRIIHREQDSWSKKCPGRRWRRRRQNDPSMCEEDEEEGRGELQQPDVQERCKVLIAGSDEQIARAKPGLSEAGLFLHHLSSPGV